MELRNLLVLLSLNVLAINTFAIAPSAVSVGGFVDTFYAFDFNEPSGDRSYTTTAARHNEFSINLAYLEMKIEKEKVRGRLALQTGSSVYSNYSGETRYNPAGASQLTDLLRHVQEGYAGYQVTPDLWIDAGVYFSHIGAESFISKDNWTYTRSLAADYSPYYQTGVRVGYQFHNTLSGQIHLMNGWQNHIETNSDKALGLQLSYHPSPTFSITYNSFVGRERELRILNDLVLKWETNSPLSLIFVGDWGLQKKSGLSEYSQWYSATLLARVKTSSSFSITGRIESFLDKDAVVVSTPSPEGFRTSGTSLNADWNLEDNVLFRNEVRYLFAQDPIFPSQSGLKKSNTLYVSSLSLTF